MTQPIRVDVLVYGATAGGTLAAIAAAREGASVALVEPGQHVGGMVSGGLGRTDYNELHDRGVIGGLALEFYARVARHYGAETWGFRGPEPHAAEQIFREWLREAGVNCCFGARVESVTMDGRRIVRISTDSGLSLEAAAWVDASYEGDLMARAGVPYAIGRESVSLYGERWAGRQPIRPDPHNFSIPVSPFVNERDGELLPFIRPEPMAPEGAGDGGVQSYCFRLCLTNRQEKQVPFPRPEGYEPQQFELLRRFLVKAGTAVRTRRLLALVPELPNGKCDVNSIGPFSTNLLDGSSWEYPDAPYARRKQIWDRHLHYTQGLLFFLANDPGVPEHIREEMNQWGLCRDEFVDTGHFPHQLYVRDARRMLGEYVMTQHDLEGQRVKYDAVGMGEYNIDIREVQRTWIEVPRYPTIVGDVVNEGYLTVPVKPYQIPYRALLPRFQACENLLVSVCVSASHVAFASIRMEPQYMILGHAAGVAAALAARAEQPVHHVSVLALQQRLLAQGQVLERG